MDSGGLGFSNALKLALPTEIHFELREYAQHIQEAFPRRRARVDRLLCRPQRGTARLHGPNDILQIADTTGEAVNACHRQYVTRPQEWSTVSNSSRPSVVVPLRFSARMTSQPGHATRTLGWKGPDRLCSPARNR
jgi:hypothetical protein